MEVTTDAAKQMIVDQDYHGMQDAILEAQHAGGPLAEDHPRMPSYSR